mmetsp:Transcript_20953/g.41937  ORF Transcript_20953/g.41937 Transcript_20953/m.41937 type:complete len:207 (-) Transcript_20953:72-692(-)
MNTLELRRVTAGIGWALHALVFEYADGSRQGRVLDNGGRDMDLSDEAIISRGGGGRWETIDAGDYIVRVCGFNSASIHYLSHGITLIFASGREICFTSIHTPWERGSFSFDVPQPGLLRDVRFRFGRCIDIEHLTSTMHLPITRNTAALLPRDLKKTLLLVLGIGNKLDNHLDGLHIGSDVWWKSLRMLRGFDLHSPHTENTSLPS